ncbi:hypothetical protein FSP39_006857 [Pinctada imbricata]|uniref:SCAN box domain-containing protein n=1 Tax=Pinctada imbricata TaxID=66713 RepID=A0AA88YBZ4_PINIB|nr:hypothetical protein FSP39_006857 [Pinctada imbricata]
MHERELQFELEKLKLEKGAKENPAPSPVKSEFDAAKNIRLVPKFQEKSVDKYFPHFEKIAANLKWPRDFWTTLLQSVLIGKAAEVYSALSIAESSDYDKVKDTILRAYQLVPEAYRQKFRKYKKFENQTYVEFAREKEDLFDQWFRSKKIPNSFDNLRQIILIEEFKECVHQDLRTHLEDKNVKTLEEAAVLSDTYALTHKKNFVSKTQSSDSAKTSDFPKKNLQESQSSISSQSPSQGGSTSGPRSERSEASPGSSYNNNLGLPVLQSSYNNNLGLPVLQSSYNNNLWVHVLQSSYNNSLGLPVLQSSYNNNLGLPVLQSSYNNNLGLPVLPSSYHNNLRVDVLQSSYHNNLWLPVLKSSYHNNLWVDVLQSSYYNNLGLPDLHSFYHNNVRVDVLQSFYHNNVGVDVLQSFYHNNVGVDVLQSFYHNNLWVDVLQSSYHNNIWFTCPTVILPE